MSSSSSSSSSSDDDDLRFASPQANTPTFSRTYTSTGPELPALAPLRPPSFAPAPEPLPAEPPPAADPVSSDALSKAKAALQSLSEILPGPLPSSLSSSPNPAVAALYDGPTTHSLSCLLRAPNSGSADSPLCRWLYDTFQSGDPALQLLVLRFVPLLSGVYLARASTQRRYLAGFEAVLLALYSHQTASRAAQPVTVTLPDLSNPSVYHDAVLPSSPGKSSAKTPEPTVAVVSPALEPHDTVRATRRAFIVGAALDLYYRKIGLMPTASKVEFCEFCEVWAGQADDGEARKAAEERIPLQWELLQPALRILGHCLLGPSGGRAGLQGKARSTCARLYGRAMHDADPQAILASQSLMRMIAIQEEEGDSDYTQLPHTRVISI